MANKLFNLLMAGVILSSASGFRDLSETHDNHKKTEKVNSYNPKEYRKHLLKPYVVTFNNGFYLHNHFFDIDSDNKADIMEVFPSDSYGNKLSHEPILYWFDKNKNNLQEKKEIFIDENMNGWNGDEVRAIDYFKRTRGI